MRKLQKSVVGPDGPEIWLALLTRYQYNTSTKPYARLMNSLCNITLKVNPAWSALSPKFPINTGPNRAERREGLQVRFPNAAERRKMERDVKFQRPTVLALPTNKEPMADSEPSRKVTGSVRRGLQRGRVD